MLRNKSNAELLLERAPSLRPVVAQELAADLAAFTKAASKILEPNRKIIWSWHLDLLCEYLVLAMLRQVLRLIINVPPRTLKSILVTVIFPLWVWVNDPQHRFITASYSSILSTKHPMMRRRLVRSQVFRQYWGERLRISVDSTQSGLLVNEAGGHILTTSVGGTSQGLGCDTAIVDDPLSPLQAASDAKRTTTNDWSFNTVRSRLDDPATGAIIVIMQRLHELDTTGYLLEKEPGIWTHIRIPLEAEEDECWRFPISGRIYRRAKGETLQPERFTPKVVGQLRSHPLVYACQYQQRPAPAEGNIIKFSYLRYYGGIDPRTGVRDEELPMHFDLKLISVDCAFKSTPNADFVAILVIGVKGPKRYILNVVNQHLDFMETEREIRRQRDLFGPINAILIEDTANGPAVIQRLKIDIPGVIPITPQGGKLSRMQAAAPEWESGDWYLDRRATWTPTVQEQLTSFPNARRDDVCDAMTQVAGWIPRYQPNTVTCNNAFTGEEISDFIRIVR